MGPNVRQPVMLVTGGAAGIGRVITDRFVADGALVIAGDIDNGALDSLREAHGDRVIARRCDVTDEASVAALADLPGAFGRLANLTDS